MSEASRMNLSMVAKFSGCEARYLRSVIHAEKSGADDTS